jgi:hypothetical protein
MSEQGKGTTTDQSDQDWYDKHAKEINVSADTLRENTTKEEWVDHINLDNATKS